MDCCYADSSCKSNLNAEQRWDIYSGILMLVTRFCTFLSQHKQQEKKMGKQLLNTFTCLVVLKCIHRLLWGLLKKQKERVK